MGVSVEDKRLGEVLVSNVLYLINVGGCVRINVNLGASRSLVQSLETQRQQFDSGASRDDDYIAHRGLSEISESGELLFPFRLILTFVNPCS